MYCPGFPPELSTAMRTASQSVGASCHSSIRRGCFPFKSNDGIVVAVTRFSSLLSGSCNFSMLCACCCAVVVFPVHFGPSMSTAPKTSNLSFNILSAILGRYFMLIRICMQKYLFFIMLPNESAFLWCFNRLFCGVSIGFFVVFRSAFLWRFDRLFCGRFSVIVSFSVVLYFCLPCLCEFFDSGNV